MHIFDPVKKLNSLFEALKDPDLSVTDKLVYAVLVFRFNSRTRQCNPSVETIAKDICKSTRTVERSLKKLREKGYITNFRGFPGKGSNMYQLKDSKIGLYKEKKKTTNLSDIYDNIVGETPSSVSCKTINETIKETINTKNINVSDESELLRDSLSDNKDTNNIDDTNLGSMEVKDSDKESITKERFYEIFDFLDPQKLNK